MKKIKHIKFGIPTLDNLFLGNERRDVAGGGIVLPELKSKTERTSVCIVGPDGSGKSLFALHMASRYAADLAIAQESRGAGLSTQIIFVSTDFSYARALGVWNNFGLDHPFGRKIPFESLLEPNQRRSEEELKHRQLEVGLTPYQPIGYESHSMASALTYPAEKGLNEVKFIDVAKNSSGDDWAFIGRLLSLLPEIKQEDESHLLVIDAVEGFETMVGENDQFGQQQTRRARVAQLMRLAATKCHLVFVAEEPEIDATLPEQFVADVVIRLRAEQTQGTTRHSLEIEKARGQRHALGRQPYFIRDGSGSSTGSERNLDDPRIFDGKEETTKDGEKKKIFNPSVQRILEQDFVTKTLNGNFQGYIHVTHSIHQRSREILELDRETGFTPLPRVARFGIPNLDSLLLPQRVPKREGKSVSGLPCNRLSALIGEAGTNKSGLGQVWMSQAFHDYAQNLIELAKWFLGSDGTSELKVWLPEKLKSNLATWRPIVGDPSYALSPLMKQQLQDSKALFDPLERCPGSGITVDDMDPAFAFLYRFRKIQKNLDRITTEAKTALERAVRLATLFLRARYGLTCEDIPDDLQDEGVAVLLSTRDETADTIAVRICRRVLNGVREEMQGLANYAESGEAAEGILATVLNDQIRRRLIVRRLEIHNATPEGVFHIIESLVHAGRRVLLGEFPYQKRYREDGTDETADKLKVERHDDDKLYFESSGRIRFVLDDFSSFRDSYPDLKHDSVFLPFLVFWLERMGVTGLIVCTADGQPTNDVTDPVEVQIRALVAQRIQTWRLGFHGTQRIAITAIPSYQWDRPSPVRELVRADGGIILDVSREFELYSNLVNSRPERVPLEIRLFSHTTAAKAFIEEENKVFRSVFGNQMLSDLLVTEPGAVLSGARTEDYDVLRDFCHLQGGSRLDRTLILQIDEFWLSGASGFKPPKQSALRMLSGYLNDKLNGSEAAEDFYGVYRGESPTGSRLAHFSEISPEGEEIPFDNEHATQPAYFPRKDRIPFTWDFGFLLCDRPAWIESLDESLPSFKQYDFDERGMVRATSRQTSGSGQKVSDIWRRLPGGREPKSRHTIFTSETAKKGEGQVTWHEFLMAASTVARVRSLRSGKQFAAFDFSKMSKGTFVCLLLEIWASEIYHWLEPAKKQAFKDKLATLSRNEELAAQSLVDWLQLYRTEFFLSLLLLTEVLNFEDIQNPADPFETRVGDPSKVSVATRHWYSTACNLADDGDLSPVGLPGHFSVRGDWYLAVADGSRSDLLAERALDLLSSRRSNVTRMQLGMGLATRSLGTPKENRTRLSWFVRKDKPREGPLQPSDFVRRFMTHADVAGLGASGLPGEAAFNWLWRSSLGDFDRQSRVFRKSVMSLLQRWYEHRNYLDSQWVRGFELYDFVSQLRRAKQSQAPQLSSADFWQILKDPIWLGRLEPEGHLRVWKDVEKCSEDTMRFLKIATRGTLSKAAGV